MGGYTNCLKNLDIFFTPITLRSKSKRSGGYQEFYRSWLGAFLTVIFMTIVVGFSAFKVINLKQSSQEKIVQTTA